MRKIVWIICLMIGASRLEAQVVVGFNFSAGAANVSGWNNLAGDPHLRVITATDATTGITMSSVNTANWVQDVATNDVAADGQGSWPGTFFPAGVTSNLWAQYGTLAQYNAAIPQLEISGLSKDSVYYIKMTSSYVYSNPTNPVQYTVSGLNVAPSQYFDPRSNTSRGVTFQKIAPDANGKIRIYVNTTANTYMACISAVQILSGSATVNLPAVAITSPANLDILAEESNIVLRATAAETGTTISKVDFFADTTFIGESTAAPYSVTWMNPNEGHYRIYAVATDAAGTANSATINISVESLTSFWSMTGNIGMNADSNFVGNVDSVRLAFRTRNTERMSISPMGNVGIGIINPTAQLHTTGTVRMAGLKNDSTNAQPRLLVSDTSGNLYYRNLSASSLTPADGLGQTASGFALGDSIPGPGPHSFSSNRYQYLNGFIYSLGGSVNDPVNHPAFRIYNNGDLSAGTTMDRSVNTADQTGFRYYAKPGYLQIGASDRIDTTQSPIVYGKWPSSGLFINSDEPNIIKGKVMNTVFAADVSRVDSGIWMENNFITGESLSFTGATNTFIRSFIGGYANTFSAPIEAGIVDGEAMTISTPVKMDLITGFGHKTLDTSYASLIGGTRVQFGGLGQLASGQFLVNRTPYGTVLGNANVDFSSLPFTGLQGTNVAGIGGYPLFAIGNSAVNGNSGSSLTTTSHSNAFTVLYNGRTQINTTGFSNSLAQADVTPKAALEVVSNNSGVLLPKLTTAQRNAIVSADLQNGLLLYNTDSSSFQYYNGSAWNSVAAGASGGVARWQFGGGTVFDTTDNIGIGTNNTQGYKLAVNGNAIFTKIKVKAAGNWPDYVFGPEYHLPSLTELDKYIATHKHLPGLPSAQEVDKDGQDVGTSQQLLLKKVEELTLYLIDLNKKVEALARENKKLRKSQKKPGR